MKNFIAGVLALGLSVPALSQELPQPSPESTVSQRIGLSDFSVTYSRPSTKERKIFDDLVPYGELWRTGANSCTRISFSTKVIIDGKSVDAGEYGLFTIPNKDSWTVILSAQTNLWGVGGYDKGKDVLRINVTPEKSDFDETFMISFTDLSTNGGQLSLEWESTEVNIPIAVDSDAQSANNVAKALSDANRSYRNAASFYSGRGEHDKAIEAIELAVTLDANSWYTHWVKAEIYAKADRKKEAKKLGKAAIEMGQAYYDGVNQPFTYRSGLEKEMKKW